MIASLFHSTDWPLVIGTIIAVAVLSIAGLT